jgi:hypothetical protein
MGREYLADPQLCIEFSFNFIFVAIKQLFVTELNFNIYLIIESFDKHFRDSKTINLNNNNNIKIPLITTFLSDY